MHKGGLILVVLGTLFLASNFGLFRWAELQRWWPLILIVVGLWLIVGRRPGGRQDQPDKGEES